MAGWGALGWQAGVHGASRWSAPAAAPAASGATSSVKGSVCLHLERDAAPVASVGLHGRTHCSLPSGPGRLSCPSCVRRAARRLEGQLLEAGVASCVTATATGGTFNRWGCVDAVARRGRSRLGSTVPPRTKAGTRSACTAKPSSTRAPGWEMWRSPVYRSNHTAVAPWMHRGAAWVHRVAAGVQWVAASSARGRGLQYLVSRWQVDVGGGELHRGDRLHE